MMLLFLLPALFIGFWAELGSADDRFYEISYDDEFEDYDFFSTGVRCSKWIYI